MLHVVGIADEDALRGAGTVTLHLSRAGFGRLAAALAAAFTLRDGRPVEAGPGLYGPSLFYEAEGRFGLLHVCNHWSAGLLHAAGLPVTPLLDTRRGASPRSGLARRRALRIDRVAPRGAPQRGARPRR